MTVLLLVLQWLQCSWHQHFTERLDVGQREALRADIIMTCIKGQIKKCLLGSFTTGNFQSGFINEKH